MILFSFPNEIQNKEVQEISDFPPWWPHWVFKEILNIKYFKINCSCFLVPIFLELPKLLRVNTAICLDPIHLLTSKVLSCISTTLYWVTFSSLKTCCNILKEKKLPWPHIPFMQFLCYSSPLYNTQNIIYIHSRKGETMLCWSLMAFLLPNLMLSSQDLFYWTSAKIDIIIINHVFLFYPFLYLASRTPKPSG